MSTIELPVVVTDQVEHALLCDQCEQTKNGVACNINGSPGVCGKDKDVQSLQEILLYGLKGMAAYANHARRLCKSDVKVSAFIEEALFATMTNVNFDVPTLLELVLECGKMNLRVMELLDEGHVEKFGQPEIATVTEGVQAGQGILITGHDLLDLWNLLEQLRGSNIKVYTHGEIPSCTNTRILQAISAERGRNRKTNSKNSQAPLSPRPTAF